MTSASGSATTSDLSESATTAAVWGRRVGIAALVLVVAADLGGGLGVHTTTRTATGGGYRLTLSYPGIARAGLDVRWRARVDHAGGFDRPITLALSGDYLSIYETQGFHPEPSAETRSAHRLLLTFDPPHGDSFVLDYDAYIQPASQRGKSGTLSLKVHGRNAASVHFHTFLWP